MQFMYEKNKNVGELCIDVRAPANGWVKMTAKILETPIRTLFFRRPVCNNITVQKIGKWFP